MTFALNMININTSRFNEFSLNAALACAVIMCTGIAFSTVLCNIFSGLVLLFWLCSGTVRGSLYGVRKAPVVLWAAAFIAFITLSLTWTSAGWPVAWDAYRGYRKFIIFLLFLFLFAGKPAWRERAILAVFISCLVLALAVLAVALKIPFLHLGRLGSVGATVIKGHIAQGLLMATLAVISIRYMFVWRKPVQRAFLAAVIALAVLDAFYLAGGRTGYLCFAGAAAASIFFLFRGWKSRLAVVLAICAAGAAIYGTSDMMQKRVGLVRADIVKYEKGNYLTSSGLRLKFWTESVRIIRDNPVLGVGVGGWQGEFCEKIPKKNKKKACGHKHPHNEYLFVASQFGAAGFLIWAAFIIRCLIEAVKLPKQDRWCFFGFMGAYLAGCLANSFTTDATEGTLFAIMTSILLSPVVHGISRPDPEKSGAALPPQPTKKWRYQT